MRTGVAPHAGSVDRNIPAISASLNPQVAPHAGSVDRNLENQSTLCVLFMSLPTRGAWIEIIHKFKKSKKDRVAPHAGSVDRNPRLAVYGVVQGLSLPTRGAWIEIPCTHQVCCMGKSLPTRGAWIEIPFPDCTWDGVTSVAPHAGSVDRNFACFLPAPAGQVAPHAGSVDRNDQRDTGRAIFRESLPTRGAWIEISTAKVPGAPGGRRSPRGERG